MKVDVTPVTGMASRANGLFIVGLVLGLLGAGVIGFLWGAVFSPVTITKTTKLIVTQTSHLTYTKTITVKGDEHDYILMAGEVGRLLLMGSSHLSSMIARHAKGIISDSELAEVFENFSKALDPLIELALKNPPPEKYLKDYQNLLEGLIELRVGYRTLAQGLKLKDASLIDQGNQIVTQAWNKLKTVAYLS